MTIDRSQRESLLQEAGLPVDCKFAVVLGRIFKFHPEFESILVNLLISFYDLANKTIRRANTSSLSFTSDYYLVVFAEKVIDYNRFFHLRIQERLQQHSRSFTLSEQIIILQRLRIIQYTRFYHRLSPFAEVTLDSYPYGGKSESNSNSNLFCNDPFQFIILRMCDYS